MGTETEERETVPDSHRFAARAEYAFVSSTKRRQKSSFGITISSSGLRMTTSGIARDTERQRRG